MTRATDAVGALVVAAAGVLVIAGAILTEDPGFGVVGPAALPMVIGVLMLGSAAWLLRDALSGKGTSGIEPLDPRPLSLSALAVGAFFAAFVPLGFPLSAIAFLIVEARILGSRSLVRDAVASVAFVAALYLVFVRLLTIDLPKGPLPL